MVSRRPNGPLFFFPKKAAPNLKEWTKFTTQNNEKQKQKSSFLYRGQFCAFLISRSVYKADEQGSVDACS